ncbi:hypothetical protein BZA70DRAFT_286709 [Myxozyma melibiosi]|uniref:Mitochondrial import inner membrane translocase subunit n=1 Tax=Myxozyma melibiosi TaxID=54550 RepID=A0ABR1F0Z1_9ASCO
MSDELPLSVEGLNAADQQEIVKFVNAEQARAKMNSSVQEFTEMCFSKCVKSAPTSDSLTAAESTCE